MGRHTEAHIIAALKQVEAGRRVEEWRERASFTGLKARLKKSFSKAKRPRRRSNSAIF